MMLKQIIEEVMLYEGLEMTHSIDASLTNLLRMWNFDSHVMYEDINNTIKMSIYQPIDEEKFNLVIKHIENFLGYFPSHIVTKKLNFKYDYSKIIELLNSGDYFGIYFDAKYDQEISDKKLPDILYHITNSIYESKILKIGLIPKEKNKLSRHPGRIYLTFSAESAKGLLGNESFTKDIKSFTLFSINFRELKKSRKIIFMNDPMYSKKGCYTYENIPPQFLKVIERI